MADNRRRYAPPPPRSRSTLSTYAPLLLTLSLASAGLAAWIWTERRADPASDSDDASFRRRYASPSASDAEGTGTAPPAYRSAAASSRRAGGVDREEEEEGMLSRAAGTIRRGSPAVYDGVAGYVGAGVAAVSGGVAAAGSALGFGGGSSADEEGRRRGAGGRGGRRGGRTGGERRDEAGFSDHERWSEEAVSLRKKGGAVAGEGKRRVVAVVVSAEDGEGRGMEESDVGIEHASILSHLPLHHDPDRTDMFVLIFAPQLGSQQQQQLQQGQGSDSRPVSGLSSSYSTISLPSNRVFNALQQQALALVSNETQILPFSTPTGYVHMLRHIAPSLVYLQDTPTLSGIRGENLSQVKGWVGQTVVVVGDDGSGGLADTETETEDEGGKGKRRRDEGWWESSDLVGLGKGVEVVDVRRVGDDWDRRVLA